MPDSVNANLTADCVGGDLPAARAKSDRELLELAAKAAGYLVEERHFGGGRYALHLSTDPNWIDWNPLTDDGDALRLAAQLKISILFPVEIPRVEARSLSFDGATCGKSESTSRHPNAATRRAIVRAAASIVDGLC